MARFLKIAIPVFLLGFVVGNAFWYLASPLLIDREVAEFLPSDAALTVVRQGRFSDADRAHEGEGVAEILLTADGTHLLRLSDFKVTNGPDLKVWLLTAEDPKASRDVRASEWLSLGPLKGNIGDQIYPIPADADIGRYRSVVIWCERFGVLFSPAPLSEDGV